MIDAMSFGPRFRNGVHTFYHYISSCVVNNGYASDFFSLQRWVRQGCPLAGLLFVFAGTPFSNQIRTNDSIKGLKNGNMVTKSSLYGTPRLYPFFLYLNNSVALLR